MPAPQSGVIAPEEADAMFADLVAEAEAEVSGEGGQPSPVAEGEEAEAEEVAGEPEEGEISEEEVPAEEGEEESEEGAPVPTRAQDRIRVLAAQARRAQKFEPILEMLESDPNIARELIAKRLGLEVRRPAEPAARESAPAPRAPTPEEAKAQSEYWARELRERPAEALDRIVSWRVKQIIDARDKEEGPRRDTLVRSNVSVLIDSFKARASQVDPERFPEYEAYFDALVEQADPEMILNNPKQTLTFLRRAAFGAWSEEQEERIAKARRSTGGRASAREVPGRLSSPGGARGNERTVARATRRLTAEEQILADRYGLELVMPDEEEGGR